MIAYQNFEFTFVEDLKHFVEHLTSIESSVCTLLMFLIFLGQLDTNKILFNRKRYQFH